MSDGVDPADLYHSAATSAAWPVQGIRGVERATDVRVSRRKRRQAGPMPRSASR